MAGEAEREAEVVRYAELTITYTTTEAEHEELTDRLLDALGDVLSPNCSADMEECGPDCKFQLASGVLHSVGWEDEDEWEDEKIIGQVLAGPGIFTPDETQSIAEDIIRALMKAGYTVAKHKPVTKHD